MKRHWNCNQTFLRLHDGKIFQSASSPTRFPIVGPSPFLCGLCVRYISGFVSITNIQNFMGWEKFLVSSAETSGKAACQHICVKTSRNLDGAYVPQGKIRTLCRRRPDHDLQELKWCADHHSHREYSCQAHYQPIEPYTLYQIALLAKFSLSSDIVCAKMLFR